MDRSGPERGAGRRQDDPQAVRRERMRAAGLRITGARLRVLALLEQAGVLLSHHDMEQALAGAAQAMDRVTLYRVLESLVEGGLAHKVAGTDRVWRFGLLDAVVRPAHAAHAHFQCRECGRIVCLGEMPAADPVSAGLQLPGGYLAETVELTVRGRCPQCAEAVAGAAVRT